MKSFALWIAAGALFCGAAAAAPTPWGADDKASAAKSQPASKEAVDPVCTMKVDPKTAEKTVYKGKTYYFCSKEDKAEFDKSPDKYAKK